MKTPERLANRYQNQPWYVKLWRCRHYLPVPYYTLLTYIQQPEWRGEGMRVVWGLQVGTAQYKMEYWYTMEETWKKHGKKEYD